MMTTITSPPNKKKCIQKKLSFATPTRLLEEPVPVDAPPTQPLGNNNKTGVQRKRRFVATPTKPVHVDAQSQTSLGNKTDVVEDQKPTPLLEGRKTLKARRRLSVLQPPVEAITELGDSGCTPDKTSSSTTDTDSSSSSPFPALWTDEKWAEKKEEYPWLDCKDGKLGCKPCSSVPGLSIYKAKGAHLSKQWSSYNVAPSGKDRVCLLKNLRKKIGLHKETHGHKAAEKIHATAKDQPFEKTAKDQPREKSNGNNHALLGTATCAVFNSAYYLAQKDRPFLDHYDLLKLQEKNGVEIGLSLHSRFSAAKIADHVGSEMRRNICKIVQAIEGKISILIDESTKLGDKTTLIVYLNCETEKNLEPHTVFLDLIELPNQKAETITNNLLNCLTGHGFDDAYLKEHLIAFASDGASVMLGRESRVAEQLSDRYPNILTWHCHRLKLAVGDTAKHVSGVNHSQLFMDKLYSVECERGFSQMNLIITPIRTKLLVKRVSALMFIKLHGPPVEDWDPTDYVISWNRYHRFAEDARTRAVPDTHKVIPDRCWKFL